MPQALASSQSTKHERCFPAILLQEDALQIPAGHFEAYQALHLWLDYQRHHECL